MGAMLKGFLIFTEHFIIFDNTRLIHKEMGVYEKVLA